MPKILMVLLLLGALAGWSQVPPSPQAGESQALEWRGQYQGDSAPGAEVVSDARTWARLWRRLEREAPALDFATHVAVVAYAGERPTGGYTIEFSEAAPQGPDLLVRWRVRAPAPDTYTTQALARPWKVKALPRPRGAVRLVRLDD